MRQVFRSLRLLVIAFPLSIGCLIIDGRLVAAHDGIILTPSNLAWTWHWDIGLLIGLATVAWLYSQGVKTLWWRAGVGQVITPRQALAFNGGLTIIFLAFASPLHAFSEVLFTAHIAQHLLLFLVAAPLFIVGNAPVALEWSLPRPVWQRLGYWWRQQADLHLLWHVLTQPRVTWGAHIMLLWIWQAPYLYKVTLRDDLAHVVQHGLLLGAALLFWRLILLNKQNSIFPMGVMLRLAPLTALFSALLGLWITFAPSPWHPIYARTAPLWGLTTQADQQVAGLLLTLSMAFVYLGITALSWRTWQRNGKQLVPPSPVHLTDPATQHYTAKV